MLLLRKLLKLQFYSLVGGTFFLGGLVAYYSPDLRQDPAQLLLAWQRSMRLQKTLVLMALDYWRD